MKAIRKSASRAATKRSPAQPVEAGGSGGDQALGTRVAWSIATLQAGSDEQRQDLVARLGALSADEKAAYRTRLVKQLEHEARGSAAASGNLSPRELIERRGWYLRALVQVAEDDETARAVGLQYLKARFEPSDWVRYWLLAQLYWTHGPRAALEALTDAGSRKDPSLLVRALTDAIDAVSKRRVPDVKALGSQDQNRVFTCLRALQVVSVVDTVRPLLEMLKKSPHSNLIYEAMRALTATPDMTREAVRLAPDHLSATELVQRLVWASEGARFALRQRFVELTRAYPPESIQSAVQERRAYDLEGLLQPPPPADEPRSAAALPGGVWRAELAYRAVLAMPAQFDVLESLSPAQLRTLAEGAGIPLTETSDTTLIDRARASAKGGPVNPLWLAWIKSVHAAKLSQS